MAHGLDPPTKILESLASYFAFPDAVPELRQEKQTIAGKVAVHSEP